MAGRSPPVFGLVLAGGHSRRFGSDKAAIEVGGVPLLIKTFNLLEALCARTFVSVRADQTADALRASLPLIVDDATGLGPAGGLLAAHRRDAAAAWLVVACDMPHLNEATLRNLLKSRRTAADATAYGSPRDGDPEPLCAIYEPATLARFARRAAEGRSLSPRELLKNSDVEIVALDHEAALTNVNAPEDLTDR